MSPAKTKSASTFEKNSDDLCSELAEKVDGEMSMRNEY